GVCSERNRTLVTSLGASRVIDYSRQDFTQATAHYDVIYDTLGVSSFGRAKSALTPSGRYICPVLSLGLLLNMLRTSLLGRQKALFSATGMLKPSILRPMLDHLLEMVQDDKLTVVMDRTYPLDQLIEAHHYMETGRKRGNVVVV
ncbi:MAG: zinc-binding dehydrogenase, partial [Alphaproteobacteria bacterium]